MRPGGHRSSGGSSRLGIWALRGVGLEGSEDGAGDARLCSMWAATNSRFPSVGGYSSQVPLLRDTDSSVTSGKKQSL